MMAKKQKNSISEIIKQCEAAWKKARLDCQARIDTTKHAGETGSSPTIRAFSNLAKQVNVEKIDRGDWDLILLRLLAGLEERISSLETHLGKTTEQIKQLGEYNDILQAIKAQAKKMAEETKETWEDMYE